MGTGTDYPYSKSVLMLSHLLFTTRNITKAIHHNHKGKESLFISFVCKIINSNHISLTENKSGTTQNLPFWVNSKTELQTPVHILVDTPLNTIILGYCCILEVNCIINSKPTIFGLCLYCMQWEICPKCPNLNLVVKI